MENELQRWEFFSLDALSNLVNNKPEVLVVAGFQVRGVGFDLVWDLNQDLFEAGENLNLFDMVFDRFVELDEFDFVERVVEFLLTLVVLLHDLGV